MADIFVSTGSKPKQWSVRVGVGDDARLDPSTLTPKIGF